MMRRHEAGFSLIELVVAIGIIGILAAIAIPSYQSSVRKSRRVEARTALLDLAGREEKLYSVSNTYSTDFTQLGWAATGASMVVGTGYYQVSITAPVPAAGARWTYTLTATPVATMDQANDGPCQSFTLNYLGVQAATGAGGNTTATCWR